jgi:hypothetical protein
MYLYSNRGGDGIRLSGEHLQEGRVPQTDKHLPPNPFTGKFLRKDDL